MNLSAIYLDPALGFVSKSKLKKKLEKQGVNLSNKELDAFYKNNDITQQNKRIVIKQYHRITGTDQSYQIDVVLLPSHLRTSNKNIYKLLVLVNIITRKAYVFPLKNNTMPEIIKAYKAFLEIVQNKVEIIQGDNEFNAKEFISLNDSHNILVSTDIAKNDHITKYGDKLGIMDAFVKNLKQRLQQYLEYNNTTKYLGVLQTIIDNYNDTPHSSLPDEATPNEVSKSKVLITSVMNENARVNRKVDKDIDINVGDKVRVVEGKGVFEKQKATFSRDIYTVEEKIGKRYKVSGLKRLYKHYELLVVDDTMVVGKGKGTEKLKSSNRSEKISKELRKEGIDPSLILPSRVLRSDKRKKI